MFNFLKSTVVKEFNIFDLKIILKRIGFENDSFYELSYNDKSREFSSLYEAVKYLKYLELKVSIYLDTIDQDRSVNDKMPSSLIADLYQIKKYKIFNRGLEISEFRLGGSITGYCFIINNYIKFYSSDIKELDEYINNIKDNIDNIILEKDLNKISRKRKGIIIIKE